MFVLFTKKLMDLYDITANISLKHSLFLLSVYDFKLFYIEKQEGIVRVARLVNIKTMRKVLWIGNHPRPYFYESAQTPD